MTVLQQATNLKQPSTPAKQSVEKTAGDWDFLDDDFGMEGVPSEGTARMADPDPSPPVDFMTVFNSKLPIERVGFVFGAIADSRTFQQFITLVIVIACIMAGVETYPSVDGAGLAVTNYVITIIFTIEIIVKMLQKFPASWEFFSDELEWRWNIFDFVIVVLCWIPGMGSSAALLRIMRLLRILKLLKVIEPLQIILTGLARGMKSIMYIGVLLFLIFYLFGIMGIMLFRVNDPWHFGSLHIAFLTLFRAATLEDWSDIMYIQIYGCESYGYFGTRYADDCVSSHAEPILGVLYFIVYIMLAALVMLSLFIGAVTMGMQDTIDENKKSTEENALHMSVDTTHLKKQLKSGLAAKLIDIWRGENSTSISNPWLLKYHIFSLKMHFLVEHQYFQNFITGAILVASLLVGIETYHEVASDESAMYALTIMGNIITYVFVMEVMVKHMAEGLSWWRYYFSAWNTFDFIIVVLSLEIVPFAGNFIQVLRLLRLLRVLKLLKAFPELQIIVSGLMKSFGSIGYIALLLFLVFYVFAIVGIVMFRENDPWHFPNLGIAIITLFRCATLEDWTDVMYINIYGCGNYGYDHDRLEKLCVSSYGWGFVAAAYFVIFTMMSALVMMNLFIGVVTTSMDEASAQLRSQREEEENIEHFCATYKIPQLRLQCYRQIFNIIDLNANGYISKQEMSLVVRIVDPDITREFLAKMFAAADENDDGLIDFLEFLSFASMVDKPLAGAEELEDPTKGKLNTNVTSNLHTSSALQLQVPDSLMQSISRPGTNRKKSLTNRTAVTTPQIEAMEELNSLVEKVGKVKGYTSPDWIVSSLEKLQHKLALAKLAADEEENNKSKR